MYNMHNKSPQELHKMQGKGKETKVIPQNNSVRISKQSLDSFCRRSISWSLSIQAVKGRLEDAVPP
jgi:hypothetical protein